MPETNAYTADEMMTIAAARMIRNGAIVLCRHRTAQRGGEPGAPDARARYGADLRIRHHRHQADGAAAFDRRRRAVRNRRHRGFDPRDFLLLAAGRPHRPGLSGRRADRSLRQHQHHRDRRLPQAPVRLPGAGGAPEIAASSKEVLITLRQNKRAFVEKLDFVTSGGHFEGGDSRAKMRLAGQRSDRGDHRSRHSDARPGDQGTDADQPASRRHGGEGRSRPRAGRLKVAPQLATTEAAHGNRAARAARSERAHRARSRRTGLMLFLHLRRAAVARDLRRRLPGQTTRRDRAAGRDARPWCCRRPSSAKQVWRWWTRLGIARRRTVRPRRDARAHRDRASGPRRSHSAWARIAASRSAAVPPRAWRKPSRWSPRFPILADPDHLRRLGDDAHLGHHRRRREEDRPRSARASQDRSLRSRADRHHAGHALRHQRHELDRALRGGAVCARTRIRSSR